MSARALDALPGGLLATLHGKTILATGCSGFFGIWTLAAIRELRVRGCTVSIKVCARDPKRIMDLHPSLARTQGVSWVQGAPSAQVLEKAGHFDYVLHMAARSDARTNAEDPLGMMLSMVDGAINVARRARTLGAPMLMVSSGAVYGTRTADAGPAREGVERTSAPDCLSPRHAYGEAKRLGEMAVACCEGLAWTVVRPFAFLGPHLPLDAHFAAGNFLRDASQARSIEIKGDGSPIRSFMHPADIAAWQLWLMALGPRGQAFNVGSDEPVSLGELACEIAQAAGAPAPRILGAPAQSVECYEPNIERARALGLSLSISRAEAISSSLAWLDANAGSWVEIQKPAA